MRPGTKTDLPSELICRRTFVHGSRKWAVGEAFDWRELNLSERRVRQLWDQRYVGSPEQIARDEARYAAKIDAVKAAKTSSVKADTVADTEPEKPIEVARRTRRRKVVKEADTEADNPDYDGMTAEDLGL